MQRIGIIISLLAAALVLMIAAPQARALSVDQVIALKRAGVSDETIRQMIHTEIKVRSMGGIGSYTVRQKSGDEWIVYEATTPQGVIDYPWDTEQYYPSTNLGSVVTVLDAKRPRPPKPRPKSAAKTNKSSSAKSYTLHLSSYQKQAGAKEQVAKLAKQGVQARVEPVTIAGKGRWHRVMVGKFNSKAKARAQGQRLTKSGSISSFRVMPR